MSSSDFSIRPIQASDVPAVVGLVHELAEYERAADKCTLTEDQLHSVLFGAGRRSLVTWPCCLARSSVVHCGS